MSYLKSLSKTAYGKMKRSHLLRISLVVGVLIVGVLLNFKLSTHHSSLLATQGGEVAGILLVTNNDGYYHLAQAQEVAEYTFLEILTHPLQSLLLARILTVLGGTDSFSLLSCGAMVGPILGLTMLLAVLPWCLETRSSPVIFLAPLLALLAPFWLERSHVGVLDTDVLVPFLVYLALYCVMKISTAKTWRWLWLIPYFIITFLLWAWWKPGTFLCLSFIGCYLVYWPRKQGDLVFKLLLMGAAGTVVGLTVFGIQPFARYGDYVLSHIRLVFGGASNSLLNNAIIELQGLTLAKLGQKSLGSPWLLTAVPLGIFIYGIRYRWESLFLILIALVFGAASLLSERFVVLFIPAAAFFATYFLAMACNWISQRLASKYPLKECLVSTVLLMPIVPILMWGAGSNAWKYEPKSYFTRADYGLAQTLKKEFPRDTYIWTWWDFGYFFKFFTEMDVFFDGGSQTDLTCFAAAYPLMQNDVETANRWIKHFANVSPARLNISKSGSSWPKYVDSYVADNIQDADENKRPVALCLPVRVFTAVGYLYSFAHIFDESIPSVANHLDLFSKEGFQYEPESGVVVVPEEVVAKGYASFGSVLNTTDKAPGQVDFSALAEPYLVYSGKTDFLAVTDAAVVRSVLFRLLGLFEGDRTLFEPVTFDYRTGGIWQVH